jgi:hypothetical protein
MPNGGLTPDCVHCKMYRGRPRSEGAPFCEYHSISLAYPIRAFCSHFSELEAQSGDWLGEVLERSTLQEDMMYVWLGEDDSGFYPLPLAPIAEYKDWSSEKFLEEIEKLAQQDDSNT